MADLPVEGNWIVPADQQVKCKWVEVQIQERKSRIARHRQDIEDLKKGRIVELEARIMMLEKELGELEQDLKKINPIEIVAKEN